MSTLAAGLDSGAALELSVIALVVALGVVVYVARRGSGGAYMGALVVAAVGLPLVATLIFWLLAAVALRPFTAPDAANATEFGNLRERWRLLQARAETLRADS